MSASIALEVPNVAPRRDGSHGRRVGDHVPAVRRRLPPGRADGPPGDQHRVQQHERREGSRQPAPPVATTARSTRTTSSASSTRSATSSTTNGAPRTTPTPKIAGIANVLLPDSLTVKLGDSAGFLNGRRLADDVIDAEFSLLTNGQRHERRRRTPTTSRSGPRSRTWADRTECPRRIGHRPVRAVPPRFDRHDPPRGAATDETALTRHVARLPRVPLAVLAADDRRRARRPARLAPLERSARAHRRRGADRRDRGRRSTRRRLGSTRSTPAGAAPVVRRTSSGSAPTSRSGAISSGQDARDFVSATRLAGSRDRAGPRHRRPRRLPRAATAAIDRALDGVPRLPGRPSTTAASSWSRSIDFADARRHRDDDPGRPAEGRPHGARHARRRRRSSWATWRPRPDRLRPRWRALGRFGAAARVRDRATSPSSRVGPPTRSSVSRRRRWPRPNEGTVGERAGLVPLPARRHAHRDRRSGRCGRGLRRRPGRRSAVAPRPLGARPGSPPRTAGSTTPSRSLDAAIAIVPLPEFVARRADLYRAPRPPPAMLALERDDRKTVLAIAQLAGSAANVYDRTLSLYLAEHRRSTRRAH